jgi:hypothetical protein
MTTEETPVRLPTHIREDAFFYKAENRAVVNGRRRTDTFAVPSPEIVRDRTFWTAIGFVIMTIFLALMGFELWFLVAVVGIAVAAGMSVLDENRRNQIISRRFTREGHVVAGEIISAVASMSGVTWRYSTAVFTVEIRYRFTSPNGDEFRASIKDVRPDLNGKSLPIPGTPVYVLFFSDGESYLL